MPKTGEDPDKTRFMFKAWYGAKPSIAPVRQPTHEEINEFVREILGLAKRNKRT